jgi:hypothetical protein
MGHECDMLFYTSLRLSLVLDVLGTNKAEGYAALPPSLWRALLAERLRHCKSILFIRPPSLRLRFYGDFGHE